MPLDSGFADAPALAILELLAAEAPLGRFHELLYRAAEPGGEGMPPGRRAELERAVRLGLRIHASLDQRRQREAATAALVDMIHDMTAPYDPDTLLKVITSRTRRLLGFDMAYISLPLPRGGSYVHCSEGQTTTLNVGLVVEEHHGLGQMAQGQGGAFWSPDYLNDDRIPHSEQIDEVVRAEGLRAVIAVPIQVGADSIGALYGADRVVRHFTPDEISLMRSLADFAAVALERARLLDRTRLEIAELESAGARARDTIARTRELADARIRLADQVLNGCDLHVVARTAGEALGATLAVGDAHGQVLSSTGEVPGLAEVLTGRAALEAHAARAPVSPAQDVWVAPVGAGVEDLGVVVARFARPLGPDEESFLAFVGRAVALQLVGQRSVPATAGPGRDEFFDVLLATPLQPSSQLVYQAGQFGIDPEGPHVVVVARPEGGEHGKAAVWAASYAYRRSGLKTVRDGCVVLLLPGTDASAAARSVSKELSPLLRQPVTVGAAGPATGLASVARVHQEAVRCLDALTALDGTGSAAAMADLGFLGLLLSDDHDVEGFVASLLGPLLEHDTERATSLIATLEAYFASGGSPTRAAEDLHVHPNTVARRLDRITELLGPAWQQPGRTLEVQLALRLLRAREVLWRQRDTVLAP
ncbi:helix-turn-helix domain-containing protein [Kitasatospora sp. NPDC059722]|uniref:helix-turn-helix domain-containing protein n=1 Tax=unclassified Kitasatospora TaxID=2633591 RepID=UPI003692F2E8